MCLQIIYSHEKSFDADQFVEIKSLGFFHDDKTPVCSLKVIDLSYLTNYSFNEKFCFCLKKKNTKSSRINFNLRAGRYLAFH